MIKASRNVMLALAIALIGAGLAGAQAAPAAATASNAEDRIFALDLGMVTGYSLNTNAATVGRSFGLNIMVADNIAIGIYNTIAGATYNFLRVGYSLTPALGFSLYVGSDAAGANTAAGLGASFTLLKSKPDSGLSSALKARFEYLFDTAAGLAKGDLVLAVSTSLGL